MFMEVVGKRLPGPLKKAGTFLPAYPAFTMLQADKLLFHLSSAFWTHLIIFSHWQAPYKILFCKVQKLKSIILNKCSSQIYTLPANGPFCQSAAYRSCPRIHRQASSLLHLQIIWSLFPDKCHIRCRNSAFIRYIPFHPHMQAILFPKSRNLCHHGRSMVNI